MRLQTDEPKSCYIIAEAGVNHNGSIESAIKLVDAAAQVGADAIKFQTFIAENLLTKKAPKADYQIQGAKQVESQFEMIKKLELDFSSHETLFKHCRKNQIGFISTPFDLDSIDLLDALGMGMIKISSGDINNLPYLRKIGKLNKNIILSTGMASLGEIEAALNILKDWGTPWSRITVLHCNTEYPTPMGDVNLKAMLTIQNAFPGIKVGLSDHTLGIEIPIAAVAMGATMLEKHFTLSNDLPGPDHKASLEPGQFGEMVKAIRNVENAFGSGVKETSRSESKNKRIVRKSIVAAEYIKKGSRLTKKNITVKRPGTGISPMEWDKVLNQTATRDYQQDDLIC